MSFDELEETFEKMRKDQNRDMFTADLYELSNIVFSILTWEGFDAEKHLMKVFADVVRCTWCVQHQGVHVSYSSVKNLVNWKITSDDENLVNWKITSDDDNA